MILSDFLDKEMVLRYLHSAAVGYHKLRVADKLEICNNLISMIESGEWDYEGVSSTEETLEEL